MISAQLRKLFHSPRFRHARKVVVTVVGAAVVALGIFLLFFPGPAFVVIPAGFAILAIEFEWARRWSHQIVAGLKYLSSPRNLKRLLYENSLCLTLLGLFVIFFGGQLLMGQRTFNDDRAERGELPLSFARYAISGHAIEATFENWESEFLQMGMLVWLTVYLRQKGAADSHKLRGGNNTITTLHKSASAPWPVRRGGWVLKWYEHSLSLSLVLLFALSFLLHTWGGQRLMNDELIARHQPPVSFGDYLGHSRFWFESFQNWQSEFLSVAVLLFLSIFLRERGSPQSKRVDAPHWETGGHQPAMPATALHRT
jgi:hypothetical protein